MTKSTIITVLELQLYCARVYFILKTALFYCVVIKNRLLARPIYIWTDAYMPVILKSKKITIRFRTVSVRKRRE